MKFNISSWNKIEIEWSETLKWLDRKANKMSTFGVSKGLFQSCLCASHATCHSFIGKLAPSRLHMAEICCQVFVQTILMLFSSWSTPQKRAKNCDDAFRKLRGGKSLLLASFGGRDAKCQVTRSFFLDGHFKPYSIFRHSKCFDFLVYSEFGIFLISFSP